MDGVLTGFNERVNILLEEAGLPEYESDHWANYDDLDEAIWPLILKDENFWTELKFRKDGLVLWKFCSKYFPNILSAVTSKDDRCILGKTDWLSRNLDVGLVDRVLLVRRSEKANFASPDSILIDDHEQNIKEFEEAGGIAFLYKNNAKEIIKKLKVLLKETKTIDEIRVSGYEDIANKLDALDSLE